MTRTNPDSEATATRPQHGEGKREVTITRIIDAPRELVFKAWTDPKHMAQWWGPRYFTNPICEMDVRPGGAILIHMRGPDGVIYPIEEIPKLAAQKLHDIEAVIDRLVIRDGIDARLGESVRLAARHPRRAHLQRRRSFCALRRAWTAVLRQQQ